MISSMLRIGPKEFGYGLQKSKMPDQQFVHKLVYDLFPEHEKALPRACGQASRSDLVQNNRSLRILYFDKGLNNQAVREILIMSHRSPAVPELGSLESKIVPDSLMAYTSYRFKVRCNPVKTIMGKRIPIKNDMDILKWFQDRAENWGFTPVNIGLSGRGVDIFPKVDVNNLNRPWRECPKITLGWAIISGALSVSSHQKFAHAFNYGIGHGRAYGCGMFQIIPLA